MIRRLAVLIAMLAAGPALAEPAVPHFGGFAHHVSTGRHAAGPVTALPVPPVTAIRVGTLDIRLERTPMAEVARRLGGRIHQQGEAGGRLLWQCFDLGGQVLWFYSDGEMDGGKVSMVALETGAAAPGWACVPDAAMPIDFGVPGIGTRTTAITARFGELEPDARGRFGYFFDSPATGREGFFHFQAIVYRTDGGTIDAVAVSQITGD